MNTYVMAFKSVLEISLFASIMIAAIFLIKNDIWQQNWNQAHSLSVAACDIAPVSARDGGKPVSY